MIRAQHPANTSQAVQPHKRRSPWGTGGVVFVAAVITDLVIFGVAELAGADMVVTPRGGRTMTIGVGMIVGALFVAIAIATVALVLLAGRGQSFRRLLATGGLALSLLSIVLVLAAGATVETKTALASMHIVTGLIWFVALWRPRTV
ncbi:DUF6069 family protein [Nocardia sp. NPDC052001]|uniref:DUF6069 family protein n=1 Tax=Nocardia sp. NPDC052001 TaxID=3154853 RepID=UPI003448AC94